MLLQYRGMPNRGVLKSTYLYLSTYSIFFFLINLVILSIWDNDTIHSQFIQLLLHSKCCNLAEEEMLLVPLFCRKSYHHQMLSAERDPQGTCFIDNLLLIH